MADGSLTSVRGSFFMGGDVVLCYLNIWDYLE